MSAFVEKVKRSLQRDSSLPLSDLLRKASRYVSGLLSAKRYLRSLSSVGANARTIGRPRIENHGRIVIGRNFNLISEFSPAELFTSDSGTIEIGNDVFINYGTSIRASALVKIGADVTIGPYCILDDLEVPPSAYRAGSEPPRAITIGAGSWLAGRVVLRPGCTLGAHVVVAAGSIVSGDFPDNVLIGGIPARIIKSLVADPHASDSLPVAQPVHGMPS
jgi:maltose O-acetyltransferase